MSDISNPSQQPIQPELPMGPQAVPPLGEWTPDQYLGAVADGRAELAELYGEPQDNYSDRPPQLPTSDMTSINTAETTQSGPRKPARTRRPTLRPFDAVRGFYDAERKEGDLKGFEPPIGLTPTTAELIEDTRRSIAEVTGHLLVKPTLSGPPRSVPPQIPRPEVKPPEGLDLAAQELSLDTGVDHKIVRDPATQLFVVVPAKYE